MSSSGSRGQRRAWRDVDICADEFQIRRSTRKRVNLVETLGLDNGKVYTFDEFCDEFIARLIIAEALDIDVHGSSEDSAADLRVRLSEDEEEDDGEEC